MGNRQINSGLSDEVIIEIVRGIKEVLLELIDQAFLCNRQTDAIVASDSQDG